MPRRRQQAEPSPDPSTLRVVSPEDPEAWPLLVAFDLDYTLWDLWIDTHITPPLKRKGDELNRLTDRRGQPLEFYREVPGILQELKRRTIHIAACSRTSAPELYVQPIPNIEFQGSRLKVRAREALSLLLLADPEGGKPIKSVSYFNTMEIYPGSKLRHFEKVHRKTGIPYDQMLFFDDEHRNFETESLGVTMQLVPSSGTDRKLFQAGLDLWRKRRGIRVDHSLAGAVPEV